MTLFTAGSLRAVELRGDDLPALQRFFEANPEYFLATAGRGPGPEAARRELEDDPPPGMPFGGRRLLGFVDDGGELRAMANVSSDFLAPGVWLVGLFIVATLLHGTGVARVVYEALEAWARADGARWMRLGVVAGNVRAERFWAKAGYAETRRRDDLRVMYKPLAGGSLDEYLAMVERDRPEHPLLPLLHAAARGEFPAPDGSVEVLPPPPGPAMAVVGFTGRHAVATAADESWVRSQLPPELGGPLAPRFLAALEAQLGRRNDGLDVVLAAPGLDGETRLVEAARDEHPRVVRANAHRVNVRVFADGPAVVILGQGLALRTEVAFEVDEAARGRGLATRALLDARRLAGPHQILFAQTAPGNAASLRALLAAGFRPIGSEALFVQT